MNYSWKGIIAYDTTILYSLYDEFISRRMGLKNKMQILHIRGMRARYYKYTLIAHYTIMCPYFILVSQSLVFLRHELLPKLLSWHFSHTITIGESIILLICVYVWWPSVSNVVLFLYSFKVLVQWSVMSTWKKKNTSANRGSWTDFGESFVTSVNATK